MFLCVEFFAFVIWGFYSASWIHRFVSFAKFVKFSAIILQVPFQFCSLSFLHPGLWWHKCSIFCHSITGSWDYFYFLMFSLCCSGCINSVTLCSSLLFLSYVPSVVPFILLLTPSTFLKKFSYYNFQFKISFWFCFISVYLPFLCWDFLFLTFCQVYF